MKSLSAERGKRWNIGLSGKITRFRSTFQVPLLMWKWKTNVCLGINDLIFLAIINYCRCWFHPYYWSVLSISLFSLICMYVLIAVNLCKLCCNKIDFGCHFIKHIFLISLWMGVGICFATNCSGRESSYSYVTLIENTCLASIQRINSVIVFLCFLKSFSHIHFQIHSKWPNNKMKLIHMIDFH